MEVSNLHAQSPFTLQSSSFQNNQLIPPLYSCKKSGGQNISPPLSWSNAPAGTKSFVLIMSDPDAPRGTWDHWILFNLPLSTHDLPQGITEFTQGIHQGLTSRDTIGYGGPCPPSGTHHYVFDLYALDMALDLPEGTSKQKILSAIEGHVLAKTTLIGTYAH